MYSRQEAAQLKTAFWTAFGQYMKPVPSAEGERVNWINYKTGKKHLLFRMDADKKEAVISIQINHNEAGLRELYFQQLQQLKPLLEQYLDEAWSWHGHLQSLQGVIVSQVDKKIGRVSIFKKEDWPLLISFFKPRIMALDAFWSEARYAFEGLH